jgi:hypothetical protein
VPPASVDRNTRQVGLLVNSSISRCRLATGILPESSTKGIPASDNCLPIKKVMAVHSLKITTLRLLPVSNSSRMPASSVSLGEMLLWRSMR